MAHTDMDALIARLEQASYGSRELDYAVLGALEGKTVPGGWATYADYEMPSLMRAPYYTTSLDAALSLIPEDWREWHITKRIGENVAQLTESQGLSIAVRGTGIAATPALALCIASLKARRASNGN